MFNPYGLMFDEITASSLVKVDQQCNKLIASPFPVNPAGFVIHSAVHAQAGGELVQVDPRIVKGVGEAMRVQTGGMGGAFVWPSLIRKLDKLDPAYAS